MPCQMFIVLRRSQIRSQMGNNKEFLSREIIITVVMSLLDLNIILCHITHFVLIHIAKPALYYILLSSLTTLEQFQKDSLNKFLNNTVHL